MTNTVKVVSMNCQGLADPRKRRDVFHYLREKLIFHIPIAGYPL